MGKVPYDRPEVEGYDEDNLGFGQIFTDNMLVVRYSEDKGGWGSPEIGPVSDFSLHPATIVLMLLERPISRHFCRYGLIVRVPSSCL